MPVIAPRRNLVTIRIPADVDDDLEEFARAHGIINKRSGGKDKKGNRTALMEAMLAYLDQYPLAEKLIDLVPPRSNRAGKLTVNDSR